MTKILAPLVTVIIPVYNHERFLAAAIESVLVQEYAPLEIIVVNDGSEDKSGDIARSYREVACIDQPNQGVAAARNAGIFAARGEFIAFLDGDDLWEERKLRLQMKYFKERPETECVTAKIKNFLDLEAIRKNPALEARLLEKDPIGTQALVARKKIFERVGIFDTSFQVGDDTDWFFRAKDLGVSIVELPEYLAFRRIHSDNLTERLRALRKEEMIRVLRNSIDRRRRKNQEN